MARPRVTQAPLRGLLKGLSIPGAETWESDSAEKHLWTWFREEGGEPCLR